MFFTCAVVSALAAYAVASPSLKLEVSGPARVANVDNLSVKAKLTNTGNVTLKLINDPRTVLSPWRTNSFSIHSEAGAPAFTGIEVKYSPQIAAKCTNKSTFTILAPGQTFKLTHDLAGVYDFTVSGAGQYKITAKNRFRYVKPNGELQDIISSTRPHTMTISGKLMSFKGRPAHHDKLRRSGIRYHSSCSSSQRTAISTAARSCNDYVASAMAYLDGISSGTQRYTTWFGTFSSSRFNRIKAHFARIGTDATNTEYDCSCRQSGTFAYVYPNSPGYIYLCNAFWSAPNTGTDSRAGTIVHEQSHFNNNGGTEDEVYGQSRAKSLAKSRPEEAIENADNHEYFAENHPML